MLINLNISNYALIKNLNFSPSDKMNTITGETGAGKSILLGALGLLLGKRADTKVLLDSEKKCVVEGMFDVSSYSMQALFEEYDLDHEDKTIIRREISPSGKSRAFINDTPTTLDVLKLFGTQLMDVHSQHDNLLIGGKEFQRFVVDAFSEHSELLSNYEHHYGLYITCQKKLDKLQLKKQADSEELDYNVLRFKELEEARLDAEEFESLEDELKIAENAQEIKASLLKIVDTGIESEYSALSSMDQISTELRKLTRFSDSYQTLQDRLESSMLELKDILRDLERKEQEIDFDESRVQYLQERFDLINGLLFKHRVDNIEALEAIRDNLNEEINLVQNLDEEIDKAQKERDAQYKTVTELGAKLSQSRKSNVPNLEKQGSTLLADLGMPHAVLKVAFESTEPGPYGMDNIEILFTANKGVAPQSIKKAASGGELSRLLFVIKYILASKTALPTIVFDEIDTGVSGEISRRMGAMMQKMAKHHQVISITHLPQVAARANRHFFVFKTESEGHTHSGIRVLTDENRVEEIAKMLSGDNPTEAAYQNAKELLYLPD